MDTQIHRDNRQKNIKMLSQLPCVYANYYRILRVHICIVYVVFSVQTFHLVMMLVWFEENRRKPNEQKIIVLNNIMCPSSLSLSLSHFLSLISDLSTLLIVPHMFLHSFFFLFFIVFLHMCKRKKNK